MTTTRFLMFCWLCIFLCIYSVSAHSHRRSEPTAWIDSDPLDYLYIGSKVTVRFSGLDTNLFKTCLVYIYGNGNDFQDPVYEFLSASCKAGYHKFRFPDISPIDAVVLEVKAVTVYEGQAYALTLQNTTVYNVSADYFGTFGGPTEHNRSYDGYYGNYYTPYYRPYDSNLWLDGNDTSIQPDSLLEVYWSGLDTYERCRVNLVSDISAFIDVYCDCFGGYAQFTKVNMPSSEFAFFRIAVLDGANEELFYFTSDESYSMDADTDYEINREEISKRTTIIMREIHSSGNKERYVFQPREINFVPDGR